MNKQQAAYMALQFTKNNVYTDTLTDIIELCKTTDHPIAYQIGQIVETALNKIQRMNQVYEEEFGDEHE